MKISTNTLRSLNKRYNSGKDIFDGDVDELVRVIGAQLGAVENTEQPGSKYEGAVIARVVSCEQHPNADRLHVCLIDDGGTTKNVDRNSDGLVQVVCGAPNVRAGLHVVWLPPDSTVPESFDKDPFVLSARELRGVISNGMLASPKELALSEAHEGILEIQEDSKPGTLFVDAFDLRDDTIIDIENKMFTHRPDCFGWLGVARELYGIHDTSYASPAWYKNGSPQIYERKGDTNLPLRVRVEIPEVVPRFVTATLGNIKVAPSPMSLQVALVKHGIRPINNVVDVTNYVMLLTGQPLHAYDYDKVRALDGGDVATLTVRYPHDNEKLTLLNGKIISPRDEAIVIASDRQPIGLGGVMGGADTEVDEQTKNIILECANFDMYSIRRTAMAHGLFTDAVTRFNKGQSPLQNKIVAEYAVSLLQELAGGQLVALEDCDNVSKSEEPVHVSPAFINERLGLQLSNEKIADLLRNVEFEVKISAEELEIVSPFWRTDIAIAEDIVEEVGRLFGYDNLPLELPNRSIRPVREDPELALKSRIRALLSRAGANEVLTYSFVHGDLLEAVGQNTDQAFQLSNALSPDLQYLRVSVLPSLLEKLHANSKAGYDEFALFEIGKAHAIEVSNGYEPGEWTNIACVYSANDKVASTKEGAAYYEARHIVEYLTRKLGISATFRPARADTSTPELSLARAVFDSQRVAEICVGDTVIGYIGEFNVSTKQKLKISQYAAGFEISMDALLGLASDAPTYSALSRFPKVVQDITLRVSADVPFGAVYDRIVDALDEDDRKSLRVQVESIGIYQPEPNGSKNMTFRVIVTSYDRTLTDQEVAKMLDTVAEQLSARVGAVRI